MSGPFGAFARLEHDGWERVAEQYERAWPSLTGQFADALLDSADVSRGRSVLDVCCGPGVVAARAAERGAKSTGLDFSEPMVRVARQRHPGIEFVHGDAQNLRFADATWDAVVMNFGILHLPEPDRALAEARRVLRPGARFGFTVWAQPELNVGMGLVSEAVAAHGVPPAGVPEGPDRLRFADETECRRSLAAAGFRGETVRFAIHKVSWSIPSPAFLFEAQRDASVRIAAVLRTQPPERMPAIQVAVERAVERYRSGAGWAVPMAACVVSAAAP